MKLTWRILAPLTLEAALSADSASITMGIYGFGLKEAHLDPVQAWCEENKCGKRTSFRKFRFHSEEQMTMFLLKWS
jgi:hypothetical protein